MSTPRDVLTPDALAMLQAVSTAGSFAAAARALGLVPSALTYRVRQIEDALDVLLFDRSSRQAKLTGAGRELLREGIRLLDDIDAVANRVKRIATGWEPQLTIAVDGIISKTTMMELCEAFLAHSPPTRIKLRDEVLSGTLQALTSGQADLSIGVSNPGTLADVHCESLGAVEFVYAVAPNHPLAKAAEPIKDEDLRQHRAVAVADSVQRGAGLSMGLLGGQDVFTVATLQAKLEAQLRGLGGGFLPEFMARTYIESGALVAKRIARSRRVDTLHYAWRESPQARSGKALQWWLAQLKSKTTRHALLSGHLQGV